MWLSYHAREKMEINVAFTRYHNRLQWLYAMGET